MNALNYIITSNYKETESISNVRNQVNNYFSRFFEISFCSKNALKTRHSTKGVLGQGQIHLLPLLHRILL